MKIIKQSAYFIDTEYMDNQLANCGYAAAVSRGTITREPIEVLKRCVKKGHLSVLEHGMLTARIVTNRAIANELTRHRHASFVQESTRYYDYDSLFFIADPTLAPALMDIEQAYLESGLSLEEKRMLLPNATVANLYMSANIREWFYILKLRSQPACAPLMRELMGLLIKQFTPTMKEVYDCVP